MRQKAAGCQERHGESAQEQDRRNGFFVHCEVEQDRQRDKPEPQDSQQDPIAPWCQDLSNIPRPHPRRMCQH